MKSFMKTAIVAMVICALASIALAAGGGKVKKEVVTFDSDVEVNGTVLKAGTYELRWDDQTGEVSILKDGKVKAKSNAYTQDREKKAGTTAIRTREKGNVNELIGVTFGGSNQDVVLGARGGSVNGN